MNLQKIFGLIQMKTGKFPKNFNVGKYKLLHNMTVTDEEMKRSGDINLYDKDIKSLPDNLTVYGNLNLVYAGIRELPENLTVKGGLYCGGSNIEKIGNNLDVYGELDLGGTKITEFPQNFKVRGNLDLSFSDITKLPDNLKVNGNLYINQSNITKLPNILTVYNLKMGGTKISEVPKDIKITGRYVDVEESDLEKLYSVEELRKMFKLTPEQQLYIS